MTDTFSRGQKVYDLNGGEYLYADGVEDGHYVNRVVLVQMTTYRGDDFDEDEIEGPLLHLKEVFAAPPKQKINDEITALSVTKSELATHVTDLQREARQLEQKIAGYKDDLEKEMRKYPHHQMFIHAASGGDLVILEKETGCYHGEGWIKHGKLVFDIATGKFEGIWDASMDGNVRVIAFRNIHDARRHFLQNYDLTINERTAESLAARYDALGLPVPQEAKDIVDGVERRRRDARLEQLRKQLANTQQALETLEAVQ